MDISYQDLRKSAVANKWNTTIWAYLSALLKCRSLEVYDAAHYEKLKEALLKIFDMTERGFKKKFRYDRPERSDR